MPVSSYRRRKERTSRSAYWSSAWCGVETLVEPKVSYPILPITLSADEKTALMSFWRFSLKTRASFHEDERPLVTLSGGDEAYFLRLCRAYREVPERASATVRLSLLSDRRIFLNEIERILGLMRAGGYADCIEETEETIVIRKSENTRTHGAS